MTARQLVGVLAGCVLAAPGRGAAQTWLPAACDIKPGHYLVNSGVLYLRSASNTQFADQRTKDLKDANRVLLQALASGGQEKNPAAWYYLGRYYLMTRDLAGADSAFTKAAALAPGCKDDIALYRRQAWVPVFNAGVQAWQAGNTDSAIASFRRANDIYKAEPMGFTYLGSLFANASQTDSAAKYFRLAAAAATDPKYAKDRRDALFNVARVYHAAQRYDDAAAGYRDYLSAFPGDVQAMAGLAGLYMRAGKRDSAMALYADIPAHADSADPADIFAAGQSVLNAIPQAPDTSSTLTRCRSAQRKRTPPPTARQIAARCEPAAVDSMRTFHAVADPQYRLAAQLYQAGLARNPYYRDALYNLAGISYLMDDTAKVLPLAQRLYALDPLSRTTLAKMAGAWQLLGKKDSVLRYLELADSVPVDIAVTNFQTTEKDATLDGSYSNVRDKTGPALGLTFEFLDAHGTVVATQQQQVPALAAGASQAFSIKAEGAGIVAWRYRRS